MAEPEDVVFEFFKKMDTTDYQQGRAAFADSITDDCVWANTGFPTAEGKEAILKMWDGVNKGTGVTGFKVDVIAWATRDDKVVTERIDHLHNADGVNIVSLPAAGTLVVRDGRIAAWRDYFDPRPLLG